MAARDLSKVTKAIYDYLSDVAYSEGSSYNRKHLMQAAAMESTMGTNPDAFGDPEKDRYYGLMQSSVIMDEIDTEKGKVKVPKYPDIDREQADQKQEKAIEK